MKDGAFILKVSAPFDVSSDHLSLLKEVELFRARALHYRQSYVARLKVIFAMKPACFGSNWAH